MKAGRIIALVVGCILAVVGVGVLLAGGALGAAHVFGRDADGYFSTALDRMETATVAISAGDEAFAAEPASPTWLLDVLDADVRLRITGSPGVESFVGIGPAADVAGYLAGVAHDEIIEIDGRRPVLRLRPGVDDVVPPTDVTFWAASASGVGFQELVWEARDGDWAAVVMNADGSPGLVVDIEVGVRTGFLATLAWLLAAIGAVLAAAGVTLIVVGAIAAAPPDDLRPSQSAPSQSAPPQSAPPLSAPTPGGAPPDGVPVATVPAAGAAEEAADTPVQLTAALDPGLSRWMWLVKWFLAIPHFVVLVVLWIAFVLLTVVAGFAILFTGRYPGGLFRFNVGVLRWTWRVSYYATTGGLGTDRYPHFGLAAEAGDVATLEIAPPGELSRGLVLVKWWLLAIPHYIIVGLLVGGPGWRSGGGSAVLFAGGLLGALVLFAAVALLFTGRYPRSIFDLVVGLNRWIYRVVAYAALMTDRYPPFRLDQGGDERRRRPVPPLPQGSRELDGDRDDVDR